MRVVSAARIINTACAKCQRELLRHHPSPGTGDKPWPPVGFGAAEQLPRVTEGIPALRKQIQGLEMEFSGINP